jgi:hypothetical protein
MASILSVDKVREYISDYPEKNLLLDDKEFSDTFIELCMDLAISEYNSMTPKTGMTDASFPSKSLLMMGTLWQMFLGRSALMARNHLTYSDGGLQIPIEEKYELYASLANSFGNQFTTTAAKLKASLNMESGWGSVSSDEAMFPIW